MHQQKYRLLADGGDVIVGPLAADQLQPHTLVEFYTGDHLHIAYLAGGGHMDTAAGAGVDAGDLHSQDYEECLSIEGNFHWKFTEADKNTINEEDL